MSLQGLKYHKSPIYRIQNIMDLPVSFQSSNHYLCIGYKFLIRNQNNRNTADQNFQRL